jgi:hypothetical protein
MLQLLDLARENAALKSELERIRQEAKELRLLIGMDGSAQSDFDARVIPHFRQTLLARTEAT